MRHLSFNQSDALTFTRNFVSRQKGERIGEMKKLLPIYDHCHFCFNFALIRRYLLLFTVGRIFHFLCHSQLFAFICQ